MFDFNRELHSMILFIWVFMADDVINVMRHVVRSEKTGPNLNVFNVVAEYSPIEY